MVANNTLATRWPQRDDQIAKGWLHERAPQCNTERSTARIFRRARAVTVKRPMPSSTKLWPETSEAATGFMPRLAGLCERTVFWLLLALVLVIVAYHVIRLLDLSEDDHEGAMMLVAQRMSEGLPNADWIAKFPSTLSPYGPVYFALTKAVSSLGPWAGSLIPGRLVSVIAAVLTAGLIGLVVGRRTSSAPLGLACGATYLGHPATAPWIHSYRVDSLGVLFEIAAYAAVGLPRLGLTISAVLLVAGSMVKQTVALAAIPIVLHLILTRRRREAGVYTLAVVALAGVGWGILVYGSHGYYAVLGPLNVRRGYNLRQAVFNSVLFCGNPVTVCAILSVLAAALGDRASVVRCRFVIAGAVALGLAAALSGTDGAAPNYFLAAAALDSALFGLYGLGTLWRLSRKWTSALLWTASLAAIVGLTGYSVKRVQSRQQPPDLRSFLSSVKSQFILVDSYYVASVASAGFVPVINDPYFYRLVVRNGVLDTSRLVDEMQSGRVGALVLCARREKCRGHWPDDIVDAMESHYRPVAFKYHKSLFLYINNRY
jgi:hypothetical protein